MTTIVAIAGSLRRKSYNRSLIKACTEFAPEGVEVQIGSIHGIPLYDADMEEFEGIPDAVKKLKDQMAKADALIIASPEYNQGVPGVLKNALDWCSRPPKDIGRVFANKPVALMGATPGGMGTVAGQYAWLPTLRALGLQTWAGGKLTMSAAHEKFDDEGNLTDEQTQAKLREFLSGFAVFIDRN